MKIYGEIKKLSDDYFEVAYNEYRYGIRIRAGKEDFSPVRLACIPRYEIRFWDGKTYNRGGNRVFEFYDLIRTTGTPKELKTVFAHLGEAIAVHKYP